MAQGYSTHTIIGRGNLARALWEPSPKTPDRPLKVGDIGFIRRGIFLDYSIVTMASSFQVDAETSSVALD